MRHENRIRISVLDAGRVILQHLAEYPGIELVDAARQLELGPTYLGNYDFETALTILAGAEQPVFRLLGERKAELRHAIFEMAKIDKPYWARTAVYGRQRALRLINDDQAQCLRDAGLIETSLEGETRFWWERLAREFRLLQEETQRRIGSEAENLTLEYEKKRLAMLGIDQEPYLVSIEDETLGYDVHSFTVSNERVLPYYIEVKGTTATEPRFFLSRNEWTACLNLHPNYALYIWDVNAKALLILTRDTIQDHIPTDRGSGVWVATRVIGYRNYTDAASQVILAQPGTIGSVEAVEG